MEVRELFNKQFNWVGHTDVWPTKGNSWLDKRTELFHKYSDWSNALAYKLFATYKVDGLEAEDYVHFSSLALLESIDRFEPSYGVPFKSYARSRVKGEVLNNIVKFSEKAQSITTRNKLIKERVLALQNSEKTNGITSIIDTILDLAIGFLAEGYEEDEQFVNIGGTGYDSVEMSAIQDRIIDKFADLSDIQIKVMNAHYREQKSFHTIASELKLSAGRISQIHRDSLSLLRRKLSW